MRSFLTAGFIMLVGSFSAAHASDLEPASGQAELLSQFQSMERTYFREHRLRAYERTRSDLRQGATCVTPKTVCWVGEPLAQGDSCSCETQSFGTMAGTVGG